MFPFQTFDFDVSATAWWRLRLRANLPHALPLRSLQSSVTLKPILRCFCINRKLFPPQLSPPVVRAPAGWTNEVKSSTTHRFHAPRWICLQNCIIISISLWRVFGPFIDTSVGYPKITVSLSVSLSIASGASFVCVYVCARGCSRFLAHKYRIPCLMHGFENSCEDLREEGLSRGESTKWWTFCTRPLTDSRRRLWAQQNLFPSRPWTVDCPASDPPRTRFITV